MLAEATSGLPWDGIGSLGGVGVLAMWLLYVWPKRQREQAVERHEELKLLIGALARRQDGEDD